MLPVVNGICIVNCPGAPLPPVKLYVPGGERIVAGILRAIAVRENQIAGNSAHSVEGQRSQDRYLAGLAVVGKAAALKDVSAIERSPRKGASAAVVVSPVSHAVMPRRQALVTRCVIDQ